MIKKYKLIIFDLDGTLVDSSEGINNSHRHTIEAMNLPLQEKTLEGVIGGELLQIYTTRFKLNDEEAHKAVEIYRNWYREYGMFQAEIYPNISKSLETLKASGYKLAVATLKREDFAKQMLEKMGIAHFFEFIFGMDIGDTLNKEKMLLKCVEASNVQIYESVLIGDSHNDAKGAKACGMDFIGVTYGFGFRTSEEVNNSGAIASVDNVIMLCNFLTK